MFKRCHQTYLHLLCPSGPQAVTLPLSLTDGKWHHVCVTWSTRDGQWEAYQDGVQRGSGLNLSPWHSIKPGGVFILGQEQVKSNGKIVKSVFFLLVCDRPCSHSSGHFRRPIWCHSVICGWDVGPAHVVTRPQRRWHLQPGLLWQPPQRRCHRLVWNRSGSSWRSHSISIRPLSLKGQELTEELDHVKNIGHLIWLALKNILTLRTISLWHKILQTQSQCLPWNLF